MAVGKAGDPALHGRSALSLIELACHDGDALVYTLCTTFEQDGFLLPIFNFNKVNVISDMLLLKARFAVYLKWVLVTLRFFHGLCTSFLVVPFRARFP